MLYYLLIAIIALSTVSSQPQVDVFNAKLDVAKRMIASKTEELQCKITDAKNACIKKLGMPAFYEQRKLMLEENLTDQEKCLLECILKGSNFMNSNNRLAVDSIVRLASMMSNNNELIVSVVTVTADRCNRRITATHPCEAAYQINRCISKELVAHKVKLVY